MKAPSQCSSSKIKILPSNLINQIAAGEVVERPASCVKELVENAIDAKASLIEIFLWDAGKKKMRVCDDGMGMNQEEARLCMERHATSKINYLEDLFKVKTLGFRGEALPSMASVSRLTLMTKDHASLEGFYFRVEAGKMVEEKVCGIPPGTEVTVEDLFFNTPVRHKFLKSSSTELSHCVEIVEQLSLVSPSISFRVNHEGRELLNLPKTSSFFERILSVLKEKEETFLKVDNTFKEWSLKGVLGLPRYITTSSQSCYFFVNGRPIRDRTILHAVLSAYQSFIPSVSFGRNYPKVVLFLEIDGQGLDVNVHPTKKEVRFKEPHFVHSFIEKSIKAVLQKEREMAGIPSVDVVQMSDTQYKVFEQACHVQEPQAQKIPKDLQPFLEETAYGKFRFIGQIKNSYLLCEDQDHLIFIDQHAAHERIIFERLKKQYLQKNIEVQYLLIPLVLETMASEMEWIKALSEKVRPLGFEIELFGDKSAVVKAVPAILKDKVSQNLIRSLIIEFKDMPKTLMGEELINHTLSTVACHSARTANEKLEPQEIQALLRSIDKIDAAPHCPHGRPFAFSLPIFELEKKFRR